MIKRTHHNKATDAKAALLYKQADEHWSNGRTRSAFRCFLAAAKGGMVPAFGIVGYFYDYGDGVKADFEAALYWYRRAYRNGSASAANNIGCIWRDRGQKSRAIWWLERARAMGDGDANLNIAKIYLGSRRGSEKARCYLQKTIKSRRATKGSREEATVLLQQLR